MQGISLVRHTLQLIIRTAAAAAVGNCNCKVRQRQKRQKPAKVFTSSALFETRCCVVVQGRAVCSAEGVTAAWALCVCLCVCVFGIKLAWPVGNTFHFVHANCHCSRQHPSPPPPSPSSSSLSTPLSEPLECFARQ